MATISLKKQVTKINFGPYERNGEQVGFSYAVNKEDKDDSTNKTSFIIGFTFGEGVVLRQALLDAITNSVKFEPKSQFSAKPQREPVAQNTKQQSFNAGRLIGK